MYPDLTSFVRRIAGLVPGLAALVLLWSMSAGCRRPDVQVEGQAVSDTLASVISSVKDEGFRDAYRRLTGYDYTRYMRTEQFDGDDFMIAYRERVSRITQTRDGSRAETVSVDSAGAFEFGFFNRFVSENSEELDPVDLAPFVLSEDPDYMRPRNRSKYEIRSMPDTLLWDTQARVIEVRARPELADGANIRRVRYYVSRMSNELVAMYLERIDLALLFREESRFYVHMRPVGDGVLLPYNSRFDTRIRTPFRKDQRFRTVSTYYGFTPASIPTADSLGGAIDGDPASGVPMGDDPASAAAPGTDSTSEAPTDSLGG